ncbi:MAG: FKBP-type peptidyl-prolyl cis-trans isomerase [Chitinophagaceae bacterium]|jgi:FKBP-type peptidyl-prolyl cis-trans isomerase|nr:FKBP-type peptidyl-prolyl cis-trans isomerase [Chitinophagaceae bacterium]
MKKVFLYVILFSSTFFLSCEKEKGCVQKTPSEEKAAMIAFCTTNSINYTEHPSGILYEVVQPGSLVRPTLDSRVFIFYTGKLLDGTTFETQSNPSNTGWPLKSLIEGWQIGLPLIQKGGRIKLVIPSSLAYGCTGSGGIGPNSPLFFDITLTEVLP